MLLDKYEVLVNPPEERWNEVVLQIYTDLGWRVSFDVYPAYLAGFGQENFIFLVAVDPQTGKAVSSVSGALLPSTDLFIIGMYYTHPDYRNTGLGKALFDDLLEKYGQGKNWFLNSGPTMVQKYVDRYGFYKQDDFHWKGLSMQAKDCDFSALKTYENIKVVDFEDVDYKKLVEFDRKITGGLSRDKFLKPWFTQSNAYNKFAVNFTGDVLGYCNTRILYDNHVNLGPFCAESEDVASTLLRKTLELIPNFSAMKTICVNVPTTNLISQQLFKSMSTRQVDESGPCGRMYTKKAINCPRLKIFGACCLVSSHI